MLLGYKGSYAPLKTLCQLETYLYRPAPGRQVRDQQSACKIFSTVGLLESA